jgi:hypothetical protein
MQGAIEELNIHRADEGASLKKDLLQELIIFFINRNQL